MNLFDRAKILAEVVELGTRAYGVIVDRSRAVRGRDARIKELERQVADLKAKAGT